MTHPNDTPTDRAAIEALARELTDEQWAVYLSMPREVAEDGYHAAVPERCAALLAYLDDVWRQIDAAPSTRRAFEWLGIEGNPGKGYVPLFSSYQDVADMRMIGIWAGHGQDSRMTPLGRAVLKRAKEPRR